MSVKTTRTITRYRLLENSVLDSNVPEGYVKIGIRKKIKGMYGSDSYNGLEVTYCSIGVCDSPVKPCLFFLSDCPYRVVQRFKRPRRNSKSFGDYQRELRLQMEQYYLHPYWNDDVERALRGELSELRYEGIAVMLSYKMSQTSLREGAAYSDLIKRSYEIYLNRLRNERDVVSKGDDPKRIDVLFKIGDYFYIGLKRLPQILGRDGRTLWYDLNWYGGWVKVEDFTKSFFNELSINLNHDDLNLLKRDMEEKFGLLTLFSLADE